MSVDAKKDMLETLILVVKTLTNARTLIFIVAQNLLVSIRRVDMNVIVQKDMRKSETFVPISMNVSSDLVIPLLFARIQKAPSLVNV